MICLLDLEAKISVSVLSVVPAPWSPAIKQQPRSAKGEFLDAVRALCWRHTHLDGSDDLLAVVDSRGRHQGHQQVLEVAVRVALQVVLQSLKEEKIYFKNNPLL